MMKLLLLIYAFWVVYALGQYTFNNMLGNRISQDVQRVVAPLNNLGSDITRRIQESLEPLDHLGWQINHALNKVLKTDQMKNGIRGTTIIEHNDGHIILKHRQVYECLGTLNSSGECSGTLKKLPFGEGKSICFPDRYTVINDEICISKNIENSGYMSVESINGRISCVGTNVKMLKQKDYYAICDTQNFRYKYIADDDNPDKELLPNKLPGVECKNIQPKGVCEF